MKLKKLSSQDRTKLVEIIRGTPEFNAAEALCAIELIDIHLADPEQLDYQFVVALDPEATVDVPLGYACFGPTPMTDATYDLYWIVVSQRARKHGFGRALLAAVEETLAMGHARHLLIETGSNPAYAATRAFYERSGYSVAARIPDYYKKNDDLIIFRKVLRRDEDTGYL